MNLRPGAKLGPYAIESLLGKGGMGEVYAARDPRLRRRVALKVLPAEIQASPHSLERFRREAQSLAALNHPGIVTIYSVEEDAALLELRAVLPDTSPGAVRALYQRWNVRGPFLESLLEGLAKAGLEDEREPA